MQVVAEFALLPPLPPHTAPPPVLARVWYLAAYLLVSNDTFTSCHLQRFVWSIKTPKNEYEKSQAQNAERQRQEGWRGRGGAEQENPYQIQSWQVLQSPDIPPLALTSPRLPVSFSPRLAHSSFWPNSLPTCKLHLSSGFTHMWVRVCVCASVWLCVCGWVLFECSLSSPTLFASSGKGSCLSEREVDTAEKNLRKGDGQRGEGEGGLVIAHNTNF